MHIQSSRMIPESRQIFAPIRLTLSGFRHFWTLLFKDFFNFPSRYLFAIGLAQAFSLRWILPPTLGCFPKQECCWQARSCNKQFSCLYWGNFFSLFSSAKKYAYIQQVIFSDLRSSKRKFLRAVVNKHENAINRSAASSEGILFSSFSSA